MKITKYLSLVLIIIATVSCSGKKNDNEIKVTGMFKSETGFEKVTFRKLDRSKTLISEAVVTNGKFELTFEATDADFYQLDFPNNEFLYLILQPGEQIKLEIAGSPVRESLKVSGSTFTEHFIEVGNSLRPFEVQLDSLNKVYGALASEEERQMRREEFAAMGEDIEKAQRKVIRDFAIKNPGSLANLFFLNKLDIKEDLAVFVNVNKELVEKYPENPYVTELNYTVSAESTMQPGMPAPDFELQAPDGSILKVSDYRGKYLLLDFWASWCGPCRRENPKVVALYNEYHDKGFEILGVSLDNDRAKWLEAIQTDGLVWNHVSDLKKWGSEAAKLYAVRSIPHTVLIDPEGNIVAVKLRGSELRYKLEELLGE